MKKYYFLIIILTGCSSTFEVLSEPNEARVQIVEEGVFKDIGKTPLSIDTSELDLKSSIFEIIVSKDGYNKQSFFLEERTIPSLGKINVKLENTATEALSAEYIKKSVSKIASQVSQIQTWLLKKNFTQAEVATKELLNENSNLAVGWNLLGNNYYLQKRFSEAGEAYQKALSIEPDNVETQSILQKLRLPSSQRSD